MMVVYSDDGLELVRGKGCDGEAGWYIDGDGRLVVLGSVANPYITALNGSIRALQSEGLSFDDVEFISMELGRETYAVEQYLRFSDYTDCRGGYPDSISLVGEGFYTSGISYLGQHSYTVCFEDRSRYLKEPFWMPKRYDPPMKGEIKERWGFGDEYSEWNHLWPASHKVRDYTPEEIAERARQAMLRMQEDSKKAPLSLSLLSVPGCRKPIIIVGKGGDDCRGYLQASFETRIYVMEMQDAV